MILIETSWKRFRKIPGIANIESFIGLDLPERKFELGVIG
jgi:hypothetical protein